MAIMRLRGFFAAICAAAVGGMLTLAGPTTAVAAFPDKPITIIIGYGPGGMTDVSTRILAERLEKILGVEVFIEHKPGAGGVLAWQALQERAADGYTVVDFGSSAYVTALMLDREIGLDDFEPVGSIMVQQRVLFGRKDMPFKTLEELIAYAKENPVTFADGGAFWASRVVEAMSKQFDLKFRLVPFKSGAEGSAAILGGHVATAETGVGTGAWLGATREGKLNVLGVLSPGNLEEVGVSGVRSISDVGAKFLVQMYYGYAVKKGTDPEKTKVLIAAMEEAIADEGAREKLRSRDLIPQWIGGEEYLEILSGLTQEAQELKAYLAE